jgi:plastocyanin
LAEISTDDALRVASITRHHRRQDDSMNICIKQRAIARRTLLATTTLIALLTMITGCDRQPAPASAVIASSKIGAAAHKAQTDKDAVTISNFAFQPATLTVAVGSKVVWTNRDDEPHRVVSDNGAFNASPALDTDDSYATVFAKAGIYSYYCSIHPHMVGKIVVK